MTRYCEKNRYIQKIENAKIILPRSCRRALVISPSIPGALRWSSAISVVAATAESRPPHDTKAPNRFEYQVCSIDMTWSKTRTVYPSA